MKDRILKALTDTLAIMLITAMSVAIPIGTIIAAEFLLYTHPGLAIGLMVLIAFIIVFMVVLFNLDT